MAETYRKLIPTRPNEEPLYEVTTPQPATTSVIQISDLDKRIEQCRQDIAVLQAEISSIETKKASLLALG